MQLNWWDRIDAAEKRGEFTAEDADDAANWQTCACGLQDKRLKEPRKYETSSAPWDSRLYNLGLWFSEAVSENDFDQATDVLSQIEDRASELLLALDHALDYENERGR